MTFDPRFPCLTRNGRKVEIIRVLSQPTSYGHTIVAIVYERDDATPEVEMYFPGGRFFKDGRETGWDLLNVAIPVVSADDLVANPKMFIAQTAARIRAVVDNTKEPAR